MYQSSFVKLLGNSGLFKLNNQNKEKVRIHPQDKTCMLVSSGPIINLKDGSEIEDGIINSNQTVIIRPNVELVPSKYHALVSHNPELSLSGAIISPISVIVRPGEEDMIGLVVRTSKKLDISEFGHIFELYQID